MSPARIAVTHFTDPGCPWAWSASPALQQLRWRFGDQLEWRHVLIGLTEDAQQYVDRGYTPAMMAAGFPLFRDRYGMPIAAQPKRKVSATSAGCRAVVAGRLDGASDWEVLRTLQLAQFTSGLLLEDVEDLASALEPIGLAALAARVDDEDVRAAYERDRAEARTAGGGPTEAQGKSAASDGPVRFTAPSLRFEVDGRVLEAGGFQPVEAYDVCLANLDPTLERRPAPEDPVDLLAAFPGEWFATAEVAAVRRSGNDPADLRDAEALLLAAAAEGRATRRQAGQSAIWQLA